MKSASGDVKVLDFGLSRLTQTKPDHSAVPNTPTHTALAGTPSYMSPEQARGESATSASDIWAFGLVLLELFTGRPSFPKSASSEDLIERARSGRIEVPRNLPREETLLLTAMLDPIASRRPSARSVSRQLERIESRPRRRLRRALAALLMVALTASVIQYTRGLQHERTAALEAHRESERLVEFMLDDLSDGLAEVGRLDLLESVAREAQSYYGELDAARVAEAGGRPALALVQIAEVLEQQGKTAEALEAFHSAARALAQATVLHPEAESLRYIHSETLQRIAETQVHSGHYAEARHSLLSAHKINGELIRGLEPGAGPRKEPTGEERWALWFGTLFLKAELEVRTGAPATALQIIDQAVDVAESAAARTEGLTADLGDVLFMRCMALLDLRSHASVAACERVRALDQELLAQLPEDIRQQRRVAYDLWLLTNALIVRGDLNEALDRSGEALALARSMAQADEANQNSRNDVSLMLIDRGQILDALGRSQEARAAFSEALDITTVLVEDREELPYLNNHFSALFELGHEDQARSVAKELHRRGYRRSEFVEMCTALGECQDRRTH